MEAMDHRRVGLIAAAILVAGCGLMNQVVPQATVALYGRNGVPGEAWFVARPIADPPQSVGFGTTGVACLDIPIGSELVMTDRAPGPGSNVIRLIAPIDDKTETLWVDVAADGSLTTGAGVPAWWVGDAQVC